MDYLPFHYNIWGIVTSVLIATFAGYVSLELVKRGREDADPISSSVWWACGSLALGTGIWSMHFVGMLALSLPIALGYDKLITFESWIAGVGVSAIALWIARRHTLSAPRLLLGSLALGGGILGMHYRGMAALDMQPGIVWSPWLVGASAAIALGASCVALLIFFGLREVLPKLTWLHQAAAAAVMGIGISGTHYTGMAAARFPPGAMCRSAGSLTGGSLIGLVIAVPVLILALTLLAAVIDIRRRLTRSHRDNLELHRRACIDSLTGMPNRLLLEERLAHAVQRIDESRRACATPCGVAVLFVDLDGFKLINDCFGHGGGDRILIEVGQRLTRAARASDTAARLGGDEFVLLMEGVCDPGDAQRFANRLRETLAAPFSIDNQSLEISASIGIALYPDHGPWNLLLNHADAAMYGAKRAGGGTCVAFERRMEGAGRAELSLLGDLRCAVERGELELHFQPKIHLNPADGGDEISGAEALVRWKHPRRGMILPSSFIPLAERTGLIREIGNWVIDEACRQMRTWAQEGLRLSVAINLSPQQLRQRELTARIGDALRHHGVAPAQLTCEITESAAMEDIETTQRVLNELSVLGVYLSIDDFGTGYSSLSYLRRMPACQLKIDRSFIIDLETNADAQSVVDGVIKLAHALELRVVAEGVETDGQRAILRRLHCDEMQGYLLSPPLPPAAFGDWINRRRADRVVVHLRPHSAA